MSDHPKDSFFCAMQKFFIGDLESFFLTEPFHHTIFIIRFKLHGDMFYSVVF